MKQLTALRSAWAEAITAAGALASSLRRAVHWSSWLCTFPRVELSQTNSSGCLFSGTFCWCEMCAAVREKHISSAVWETACHNVWVPTYLASGQLSSLRCYQKGRLTQRQKLPWRYWCWIPHAFQGWIWKTSQLHICLRVIACTSEKEAFKGDCENNYIYSQREGGNSSFFQGQVPALLRSAQ